MLCRDILPEKVAPPLGSSSICLCIPMCKWARDWVPGPRLHHFLLRIGCWQCTEKSICLVPTGRLAESPTTPADPWLPSPGTFPEALSETLIKPQAYAWPSPYALPRIMGAKHSEANVPCGMSKGEYGDIIRREKKFQSRLHHWVSFLLLLQQMATNFIA